MPHSDAIILQALGCTINFSRLIADLREKSGLSRQDFADKLEITQHRLINIEAGKVRVMPKDAAEFAQILKESEEKFVRLALQDLFDKDGLNYNVVLEPR